jgi:DNA modification methylase
MIILGDCLEEMGKLQNGSVNHVFTSPPYNRKRNDKYAHYEDTKGNYLEWQISCIKEMLRVSAGHVFYNIQTNYYNRADIYRIMGEFADQILDVFIWEKSNPMPASGFAITNAVEYFIVFGSAPLRSAKTYTKNIITTAVNSQMPKEHKAVMKLEVAEFFITNFTKENDLVLDPFFGVGTTGKACVKNKRNYLGIEIIPEYYEIASTALKSGE